MTTYLISELPTVRPIYVNPGMHVPQDRTVIFNIPNMYTVIDGWRFLTKESADLYEVTPGIVTTKTNAILLRQEIPFECWFADHGCNVFLTRKEAVKARFWALLACLEGAVVTLIAAVVVLALKTYAKIQKKPASLNRRVHILNTQWQGLKLSAIAIISPNKAKFKANYPHPNHEDRRPCIGKLLSDWTPRTWGSVYLGKRTPLSHL
jgi:hypothetical protein